MAFSLACGSDGKGTGHNFGPPDPNKIGYDANFNLSARGGGTFHYDAEKRATRVTVPWDELVHNVYDGLGRCVLRKEWGVVRRYGYDGWKPFLEWDSWGTLVQWRLYGSGPDEILVAWTSTHGYLLYKLDRRGSVVGLLDLSDQIVENYTYDVFGTPVRISDQLGRDHGQRSWYGNRFMFTGREYFAEMGIYDYRHRWYDAQLGRFLQPDPLGFAAGDNNLFRYCGGDPVNKTDPMGLTSNDDREPGSTNRTKKKDGPSGHKPNNPLDRMTSLGGGDWIGNSRGLGDNDIADLRDSNRTWDNLPMGGDSLGWIWGWGAPGDASGVPAVGRTAPIPAKPKILNVGGRTIFQVEIPWKIHLADNKKGIIDISNVMIREQVTWTAWRDFDPKDRHHSDNPTYRGVVTDTWRLPFTSIDGYLTSIQTIFVGDRQAQWTTTVFAKGNVVGPLWAPLGPPK